jgi:hypothetical protein
MLRSAGRGRLLVRLGLLGGGLGLLVPGGLLVARALAKRGGLVVLALAIEVEVSNRRFGFVLLLACKTRAPPSAVFAATCPAAKSQSALRLFS